MPGISVWLGEGTATGGTSVVVGTGGYDGLLAVAEVMPDGDGWLIQGFIIDGELPPTLDVVAPRR